MPYPPQVQELARWLDPICWASGGQANYLRRTAALRAAQKTIDEVYAENFPQPKRDSPMPDGKDFLDIVLDIVEQSRWHHEPEPVRYHARVMKIAMMLHFATVAGPFTPEAQRTSPAYTKFVKQLLADDLIERPTPEQREAHRGWAYKATERGLAYVEALKDVQLPVLIEVETKSTWSVPE